MMNEDIIKYKNFTVYLDGANNVCIYLNIDGRTIHLETLSSSRINEIGIGGLIVLYHIFTRGTKIDE